MGSLKPTIVNIVNSSLQYNTGQYQGGGLVISFDSSDYFYCSAKVDIKNVTFIITTRLAHFHSQMMIKNCFPQKVVIFTFRILVDSGLTSLSQNSQLPN